MSMANCSMCDSPDLNYRGSHVTCNSCGADLGLEYPGPYDDEDEEDEEDED